LNSLGLVGDFLPGDVGEGGDEDDGVDGVDEVGVDVKRDIKSLLR